MPRVWLRVLTSLHACGSKALLAPMLVTRGPAAAGCERRLEPAVLDKVLLPNRSRLRKICLPVGCPPKGAVPSYGTSR